jgi:hypothetical protein
MPTKPVAKKTTNYLRLEALRDVLETGPLTRKEIEAKLLIINAERRLPDAKSEPAYTVSYGLMYLSVFDLISEVGAKYSLPIKK